MSRLVEPKPLSEQEIINRKRAEEIATKFYDKIGRKVIAETIGKSWFHKCCDKRMYKIQLYDNVIINKKCTCITAGGHKKSIKEKFKIVFVCSCPMCEEICNWKEFFAR